MYYVNVYRVDQAFGGPEEGGWYYETGELVMHETYHQSEVAESRAMVLRLTYKDGKNRYSVMPKDDDFIVRVEDHIGEDYPKVRPHYE